MSALDPPDPVIATRVGERGLDLQRLPRLKRVQMLEKFRQELDTESLHGSTRLVARLVLVEAPVGIARRLPDIEAETFWKAAVARQDDIDGATCTPCRLGRGGEGESRAPRGRQSGWNDRHLVDVAQDTPFWAASLHAAYRKRHHTSYSPWPSRR